MTALWNGLAAIHSQPSFRQEFLADLERLHGFQKNYPDTSSAPFMERFESKVRRTFNQKFSRKQIEEFRACLNQSN